MVCREEFELSLDPEVVPSNLGADLEGLVVRKDAEGRTPQISAEALGSPDDATSLEIECPVALRLEDSAADEREFLEERPYGSLHGQRKNEIHPLLQERGDGPNPLGHVCQTFPVVG